MPGMDHLLLRLCWVVFTELGGATIPITMTTISTRYFEVNHTLSQQYQHHHLMMIILMEVTPT